MSQIVQRLKQLIDLQSLSEQQSYELFAAILNGEAVESQTAAVLTALRMKGETVDELVGLARVMRERVTPIPTSRRPLLDTCGTGGDELRTFNISTATAIVAAACGCVVAKHGNRSVSSTSGSADVLEQLGVRITLSAEQVGACIDTLGIGFCFAPLLHAAMKHAGPVRKALGFRTIFNLMGPLTNPAAAEYQLIGSNRNDSAERLAGALARLGTTQTLVVCGNGELDEVCLWGPTIVFRVRGTEVTREEWTPASFGLPGCDVASLRVQSATESADVLRRIFAGEDSPHRHIVLANTAAALLARGTVADLRKGVQLAAQRIDSGAARQVLGQLQDASTRLAP